MDDLQELNLTARQMLSPQGLIAYEARKAELLRSPNTTGWTIEEILRGWLWDESEQEASQEMDYVERTHLRSDRLLRPLFAKKETDNG